MQQLASAAGVGPTTMQGEMLKDDRPERLRLCNLGRIDAVARPDEQAEDQRKQQSDKTDDRADHRLAVGHDLNWQQPLQEEAKKAAHEGQKRHDHGSRD
jgi:hypothetical protein